MYLEKYALDARSRYLSMRETGGLEEERVEYVIWPMPTKETCFNVVPIKNSGNKYCLMHKKL